MLSLRVYSSGLYSLTEAEKLVYTELSLELGLNPVLYIQCRHLWNKPE